MNFFKKILETKQAHTDVVPVLADSDITAMVCTGIEEASPIAFGWQWKRHVQELGALLKHVTKDDATPEINPSNRAFGTSKNYHLVCHVVQAVSGIGQTLSLSGSSTDSSW